MRQSKYPIGPIWDRYYGEGGILAMKAKRKSAKKKVVIRKVVSAGGPALRVNDGLKQVCTVAEMMKQAQKAGIKNFRVLNRVELTEALEICTTKIGPGFLAMENHRIQEIVKGAVSRWKSGWGSEKAAAK